MLGLKFNLVGLSLGTNMNGSKKAQNKIQIKFKKGKIYFIEGSFIFILFYWHIDYCKGI